MSHSVHVYAHVFSIHFDDKCTITLNQHYHYSNSQQPHIIVILMSSLVIMEIVYLKALSAISMMTVEITVMKKNVVCDVHVSFKVID